MRREQIRIALAEASKLGPHKEFVVAGSLSVLGLKEVPPEMMSMSIDIDFFPLHDQTHVQDIAEKLGEDSAFHETHGYFLDPIAASVLVLPPGWMERMVLHEFEDLRVYFLDVNDTAISKYVRSAENDFRWLDAGLQAGLLDLDKIDGRSKFSMDYPGEDRSTSTASSSSVSASQQSVTATSGHGRLPLTTQSAEPSIPFNTLHRASFSGYANV